MKTPEDEAFDEIAKRQGGFQAKRQMAADKQQEPVTKDEALKIALDYIKRTSHWEEGRDRHDTLKAVKAALAQPAQEPTYTSTQATTCAGCGEHKHTPLRIDAMGGYVCLTCIDKKLGTLLGEFGYSKPAQEPVAWMIKDRDNRHFIFRKQKPEVLVGETLTPLYTTPPQREWVGLTDEERDDLLDTYITAEGRARAIEQYLKEKNT